MADFVALYRGRTVSEAELVTISAKPQLVEQFFTELLAGSQPKAEVKDDKHRAPVLEMLHGE